MVRGLGSVGVALIAAAPALATTSISGTVAVDAKARLGAVTDAHTDGTSAAAPNSVTLSASTSASVDDAGASDTVFKRITATWASADTGSIDLDWGWNINARGYNGYAGAFTDESYPNWQYIFVASGNGTFSGTYNVLGSGNPFGLEPLVTSNDWKYSTLGGDIFNPNGSGTFSVALVAGHTYKMSLANFGNVFNPTYGIAVEGSATSNVQWHIDYSAAPEPASWAMMLGGFGLIGGTIRSRRKTVSFGRVSRSVM
jgi:hypothetical protein